jgi:hypothetical protein
MGRVMFSLMFILRIGPCSTSTLGNIRLNFASSDFEIHSINGFNAGKVFFDPFHFYKTLFHPKTPLVLREEVKQDNILLYFFLKNSLLYFFLKTL